MSDRPTILQQVRAGRVIAGMQSFSASPVLVEAMGYAGMDFVVVDMPATVVSWTETVLNRAHVYFALMELDLRSAHPSRPLG